MSVKAQASAESLIVLTIALVVLLMGISISLRYAEWADFAKKQRISLVETTMIAAMVNAVNSHTYAATYAYLPADINVTFVNNTLQANTGGYTSGGVFHPEAEFTTRVIATKVEINNHPLHAGKIVVKKVGGTVYVSNID